MDGGVMAIARRSFLQWLSAGGLCIAWPNQTNAIRAGGTSASGQAAGLSKRCVLNMNFLFGNDYAFINHLLPGGFGIGEDWTKGIVWSSAILDRNGYPTSRIASGRKFGFLAGIPSSSNFNGPYVLTWKGKGRFSIDGNEGTWSVNPTLSRGYRELSNGVYD